MRFVWLVLALLGCFVVTLGALIPQVFGLQHLEQSPTELVAALSASFGIGSVVGAVLGLRYPQRSWRYWMPDKLLRWMRYLQVLIVAEFLAFQVLDLSTDWYWVLHLKGCLIMLVQGIIYGVWLMQPPEPELTQEPFWPEEPDEPPFRRHRFGGEPDERVRPRS